MDTKTIKMEELKILSRNIKKTPSHYIIRILCKTFCVVRELSITTTSTISPTTKFSYKNHLCKFFSTTTLKKNLLKPFRIFDTTRANPHGRKTENFDRPFAGVI